MSSEPKPTLDMKLKPPPHIRRIATFAFAFAVFAVSAKADINEKKVLRDASGVFKGVIVGGTYSVVYDGGVPAPFSFKGPTMDFRERARLKDGRSAGVITDDDLEGNGSAKTYGTQDTRVTRGGGRVVLKVAKGFLNENNEPTKGPWTNGKTKGNLDDRGSSWKGSLIASGRQRNGDPPDHTRTVTGRKISGKG